MKHARVERAARAVFASIALSAAVAGVTDAQAVLSCKVTVAAGKCSPTVVLPQPATIVNPALLKLTVSPTSSSYTATAADMNVATGLATPSVISLTVQGNRTWKVQVNGNSAFWTASAGAWTTKPVSDLVWSLTPAGARTAMSTTATTVTSGTPGPGSPVSLYVRPIVHWTTDKPGTYTMNVTFTLTSP